MEYFITPRVPGQRPADDPDYDGITFVYVFTTVLTPWVQPPINGEVTLVVANAQGFVAGMTIVIENAGYYEVVSTDALNRMTVMNFGTDYNVPPGAGIDPGKVTTTSLPGPPGGIGPPGPEGPDGPPGPPLNAKGTVATVSDLPATGNIEGDFWTTADTGESFVWSGSAWIDMGQWTGDTGSQGPIGPRGAMGPQGNPGPVGPTGPQGSQGPAGGPGPSGPQGSQGPVGPQGPKGNDGTSVVIKGSVATHADLPTTGNTIGDLWIALDTSHGWVWSAGNIWADVGPIQGPAGPAGAAGPTGAPGAAATIAVGTTSTGAAGSAAAVTNVGSSSAAIFNFAIPQGVAGTAGPQGIPGNEGDQGPQGPQGPQGAAGSPGAQGPQGAAGAAGPPGPTAVSANTGNVATLGSDSLIYVPDPASEITSVRLRSFNAIGNPNFEVCQRNTGALLTNPGVGAFIEDRWAINKIGATMGCTVQSIPGGGVPIPGLNFNISRGFLRLTLTAAQASLAASDQLNIFQYIEGARFRELSGDAHSVSLLVRSSVAGLKFGLRLGDSPSTTNLTKLCTIPNANTWTLISLPNLPVWPSGNFSTAPGVLSYLLCIILAAGATITAPANDTWQAGASFLGAVGQSNFAASPVNSTFDIAFVQHEPGPLCSTLIDKPFAQNYDECLRYYAKSFAYAVVPTATFNGAVGGFIANAATAASGTCHWPKRLARTPGVIGIYSPQNGAANTMYNLNSGANASAVVNYYNEVGLLQLTGSGFTVGNSFAFHYTADTGW